MLFRSHERNEEHPEAEGRGDERRRHSERGPTEHHEKPTATGVAKHADQRVECAPDEPRDRKRKTDLGVRQAEVVAQKRPRSAERAVHELVEELDRKQEDDDAGSSAPA